MGAMRVTFWGALTMALTARVGTLLLHERSQSHAPVRKRWVLNLMIEVQEPFL